MNRKKTYCKYHKQGYCHYGFKCHNIHDNPIIQKKPCRFYEMKGYCNLGPNCKYIHHTKLIFENCIDVLHITTYYPSGETFSKKIISTKNFINFKEKENFGIFANNIIDKTLFDYQKGSFDSIIYQKIFGVKQQCHQTIEKLYLLHLLIPLGDLTQIIFSFMELHNIMAIIKYTYPGGN